PRFRNSPERESSSKSPNFKIPADIPRCVFTLAGNIAGSANQFAEVSTRRTFTATLSHNFAGGTHEGWSTQMVFHRDGNCSRRDGRCRLHGTLVSHTLIWH